MADIADLTYPDFGAFTPSNVQLRAYESGADGTKAADLAAVVAASANAGHNTIVLTYELRWADIVARSGIGWRNPLVRLRHCEDLLTATAELYRAWATMDNSRQLVVVFETFSALATGVDGGHDDDKARAWLEAAMLADPQRFQQLTGLDLETYTGTPLSEPVRPAIIAGVRLRSGGTNTFDRIMGGGRLVKYSHSVVEIGASWVQNPQTPDIVRGRAVVLKAPTLRLPRVQLVRCADQSDCWRTA